MNNPSVPWCDSGSLAEAIFVSGQAKRAITRAITAPPPSSRIDFQTLYTFATDPAAEMSPPLARALKTDRRTRDDLRRLLTRTSDLPPLMQAAASSTAVFANRSGAGFDMTIRESRADANQLYLMIRLRDGAAPPPRTLFVISEIDGCRKIMLPNADDGVVQLLLEAGSDLAVSLCDPKTDVFLR
jgi:hypothetical protein